MELGLFNGLRRIQIKFSFFHFHVSQGTSIGDSILSLSEAAGCGCWPATEKTYSMNSEFWKQLVVGIVRVPIPTESILSYWNRWRGDGAVRRRGSTQAYCATFSAFRATASVRAQKGDRRICAALLSNRHQPGRLLARCSMPYVFSSISARFRIETQSVGPISTQSGTSSAASQLGPLDANSGHSPTEKRTGQRDPKRAFPVSPGTDPKRQRAALLKQLDMLPPERLCTVVDQNEMNVVGRQAIGSRPPDGACGVGSASIAMKGVVVLAEERRQGK